MATGPDQAANPELCWLIGAAFVARTRLSGRSLPEWADVVMITKGINGGMHGLGDRKVLTGRAYGALSNGSIIAKWQSLLLNAGFDPGPIDGLDGPKARAAMAGAEAWFQVTGDDLLAVLRDIT